MPQNVASKLRNINILNHGSGKSSLDSDSLTTFFFPCKNRAPPIYPNAQTGPSVTPSEFSLFYVGVILLIVSLGLTAMSIWSFVLKAPYKFLDSSIELAYFALPVALLCVVASLITFSVHNEAKSRKFLSLVVFLLTFSIAMMVIGVYIGITHKLRLKPGEIENDPVLGEFRDTMRQSMEVYGRGGKVWDEIQTNLGCCGVDNYTDWLVIRPDLPESCCKEKQCEEKPKSTGCLRMIVATLTLQTCLFNGINCVALFLQCCAFLAVTIILFSGKTIAEE